MVNWGYTIVVAIAIDVESSLLVFLCVLVWWFFFPQKEKKEKFRWGRPNGLPVYDTG